MLRKLLRAALVAALLAAPLISMGAGDKPARPVNPYQGNKDVVAEGASLLNQYCSHCHGPNAIQGERPRDLRRLNLRYGNDAIATFYTTVQKGRMEKGMPVWGGVLPDDIVWKIYTFLQTVQTED
ncbi:MAG: c-type cytochrome [Burkholderiales bacterium]